MTTAPEVVELLRYMPPRTKLAVRKTLEDWEEFRTVFRVLPTLASLVELEIPLQQQPFEIASAADGTLVRDVISMKTLRKLI